MSKIADYIHIYSHIVEYNEKTLYYTLSRSFRTPAGIHKSYVKDIRG